MTEQIKISCYIRTLNEARMIGAVVNAARKVASEVIVIDSGSTDGTRSIAAENGARVIEQKWLGNGFQKRIGEDASANDWLLDLDADEIVTDELAQELKELFSKGEPPFRIYEIPLVIAAPFGKPWLTSYVRPHTKLYDRRTVRSPEHYAWDHFKIPAGLKVGRVKAHILHYAFTDLGHMMQKINGWSTLGAKEGKMKSLPNLIFRLLFAFPIYFLRNFLLRGLWRKGIYGFVYAVILAYGRWLRDAKMYEISKIKENY